MPQMDTGKEAIKARVVAVREEWKKGTQVDQFKLAIFRFIADALGVKDDKVRTEGWKQFVATAGGFGSNLSGWNQANGFKGQESEVEDFAGKV